MTPAYHAPPAKLLDTRRAAAEAAYNDLSPEARAETDDYMLRLQRIRNIGPAAALEILAAIALWEKWPR